MKKLVSVALITGAMLMTNCIYANGRGVEVVIQNASGESLNVSSDYSCINGHKIDYISNSPDVTRHYLEAANGFSCLFSSSNGHIKISGTNNNSQASVAFSISNLLSQASVDGSPSGLSIEAFSINTISRVSGVDLIVVNIKPIQTTYNANLMTENSQLLLNKPLSSIVIPGTHDSFTYNLSDDLCKSDSSATTAAQIPYFGIRFARTQNLDFNQQLNNGIRYFDTRLCLQNNKIYTTHALISKDHFFTQINSLSDFLNNNPKEIVILDINHTYGFNSNSLKEMLNAIYIKFNKNIVSYSLFKPDSTYGSLINAQKNLIVILSSSDYNEIANDPIFNWVWGANAISSTWNEYIYKDPYKINQFLSDQIKTINPNQFFVSQTQFTPDTNFILKNPSYNLQYMNYLFLLDRENWLKDNIDSLNIYIRDFSLGYDGAELAKLKYHIYKN